ncbi:hypothetical protein D187_009509 [Cystobacter fuscus DSM 2262]|uniref:Uncharacterized protein n=1 Tax=Cystobacter fuscus (strain ATCC 25194 / DSM 2262 / NBRC 100088 / M29) TaxID=1242864 RepID=S9NT51_CYSF2|nr:hypothetical protein D187_009509 [Cystobacter fuscus DSM 2262]
MGNLLLGHGATSAARERCFRPSSTGEGGCLTRRTESCASGHAGGNPGVPPERDSALRRTIAMSNR